MDRFRKYIEFRLNITTIITLIVLIAGFAKGYGELKAEHKTLATEVHSHIEKDEAKFSALASKETRAMRDEQVDARFEAQEKQYQALLKIISEELTETNRRLASLERMHMRP